MIVYFDTSAFVPLLIDEPATPACVEIWRTADVMFATRLLHVEVSAALARAERVERIGSDAAAAARRQLDILWSDLSIVELDDRLMREGSEVAQKHSLRGYDAVHCAAASLVAGPQLIAASGDAALLSAWRSLGLATFDASPFLPST